LRKAVFLDRDGILIVDVGYLDKCEDIAFFPEVVEGINLLNRNNYEIFIVTNQSGVARGYYSIETVEKINEYIKEYLAQKGAVINKFYYCPHHVEGRIEPYNISCNCRKPDTGMIDEAVNEFGIDLKESFLVGDKSTDIEAGRRAGCKTVLVSIEDEGEINKDTETTSYPDYTARNLLEAAQWIVDNGK